MITDPNAPVIADIDALYRLLPVVVRERDRDNQFALRALLRIVAGQAQALEQDIWQLYSDHFIETCQEWIVPYIGDLVSSKLLFDPAVRSRAGVADALFDDLTGAGHLGPPRSVRARADVAQTVHYRRRKGTLANLEALARDVTGWGARVVEMRERLASTQWPGHLRPQAHLADLRSSVVAEPPDGPFDSSGRSISLRAAIDHAEPNLEGIAVYLWRLEPMPLERVPARRAVNAWRYHISPLGAPQQLFRKQAQVSAGFADRLDLPAPISRTDLFADLAGYRSSHARPRVPYSRLYGDWAVCSDCAVCVYIDGQPVPLLEDFATPHPAPRLMIECERLDPWPARPPDGRVVVIDPETGRLALGDGWEGVHSVETSFWFGFSGALGGGPYDRQPWLIAKPAQQLTVGRPAVGSIATLAEAVNEWEKAGRPPAVIKMLDGGTLPTAQEEHLAGVAQLAIQTADPHQPWMRTDDRGAWLIATRFYVRGTAAAGGDGSLQHPYSTVIDALAAWRTQRRPTAVITVLDSRTYALPSTLRLPVAARLAIEAADGQRPLLRADQGETTGITVRTDRLVTGQKTHAGLTFNGVVLEGDVTVDGALRTLRILHSTLIPGRYLDADGRPRTTRPSLIVTGRRGSSERNMRLRVEIAFSITGPLRIPEDVEGIWILDSIVDGLGEPALSSPQGRDGDTGPAWLERVTVLGRSFVKELTMASNVIFTAPVVADRTQAGCLRYSYVARGSVTPSRFACEPDASVATSLKDLRAQNRAAPAAAIDEAMLVAAGAATPRFTSEVYGISGYCQLAADCPAGITGGGEHGSEMGAFNFLMQPGRASNLSARLDEYLPLGLEPQIIYVT